MRQALLTMPHGLPWLPRRLVLATQPQPPQLVDLTRHVPLLQTLQTPLMITSLLEQDRLESSLLNVLLRLENLFFSSNVARLRPTPLVADLLWLGTIPSPNTMSPLWS